MAAAMPRCVQCQLLPAPWPPRPCAHPANHLPTLPLPHCCTPQGACNELCGDGYLQAARLAPPGGPVFSLAVDSRSQDGMPDQVYCGNHAKQVVVWVPPKPQLEPNVSGRLGVQPAAPFDFQTGSGSTPAGVGLAAAKPLQPSLAHGRAPLCSCLLEASAHMP